ncbi:MAG: S1-like domain-containing RNA-binding protein [Bacteroidota bacterium]
MELGKINKLKVVRIQETGYYLSDGIDNEVFLPKEEVEKSLTVEENIEVFIYNDTDKNFIATTQIPFIQFEKFAYLKAKKVNKYGAFMDWGMPIDLLIPFDEQSKRIQENKWYLVFMIKDERSGRLIGSCKINEFVFFDKIDVKQGDEVELLLYEKTDLGMSAIVNNLYKGLIFDSDIHKKLHPGETIKGFVKQVREDGKMDLLLEPLGYKSSIDKNSQTILTALKTNDGFLDLTDKSPPEEIKSVLGLSKKAFKRSLGNLYKQKIVDIYNDGVKLL